MVAESDDSRRVDEELLRHLGRVFGNLSAVSTTSLFPATKQESLVVGLDPRRYPEPIDEVTLEVRAYANGDVHVSYLETYLGERRRCRWDRHDQPHNARDHFHPLPNASSTEATDRDYPADLTALLRERVLPWIDDRLGTVWDEDR